ncbi:MAG: hypothetical protein GX639_08730 [Fibrobacter sp.]|nr:hypothetical protein [Fibrobacter sp.]
MGEIDWTKENILFIENKTPEFAESKDATKLRPKIEPWLTALFQSEHLSLLTGAGITYAVHKIATGNNPTGMSDLQFNVFADVIKKRAQVSSELAKRGGTPNIEDQLRVANEIACGLRHLDKNYLAADTPTVDQLNADIKRIMNVFISNVLVCEKNLISNEKSESAIEYLMSFLVSFTSRSATRERLNIFTTNYDRYIEFACDIAGIRLLDRFVGTLSPVFRASRQDVDMHYNPPGIRGEPRYLEGVAHISKLHGSLDWVYHNGYVRKIALPFGARKIKPYLPKTKTEDYCPVLIYPNAAKDRETSEYPYVELFRDFAAAVCRPNSTLIVYGYSFGDGHINRVIKDMLTIPSAHLVIIAFKDDGQRISNFAKKVRTSQLTVLMGSYFGDLQTLVDNYLPKPAIDRTTIKMAELLKARGISNKDEKEGNDNDEGEAK